MTDSTTPTVSDPGELGPSATPAPAPAPAPRPSAPENPRARGHSPARDMREAAAARAPGEAPPVAAKPDAPAATGEPVKIGDMSVTPDELKEFFLSKADAEARAATLPQSSADYQVKLPDNFKPPAGTEISFDENDPAIADARAWAHSQKFSQQQFSEMLQIYGSVKARENATFAAAHAAELGKLGANATMRVTSVENFLRGHVGDDLAKGMRAMLVTADIIGGFEKLISKFQSQGAASFSQAHRVAPEQDKIPGYETMSFEQRRFAQDRLAQR